MKQNILFIIIPFLVNIITRVISITSKTYIVNEDGQTINLKTLYAKKSCLFAFWHGRLLFSLYIFKILKPYIIVSKSKDGEYISRLLKKWLYLLIRGSSSKGSKAALNESIEIIQSGNPLMITPDGPRGPYRKLKAGVIKIGLETGCDIFPIGCGYSKKITLKSWDSFQIPKPFSKIVLVVGKPVRIDKNLSREEFTNTQHSFENILNRITEKADKFAIKGILSH